jgi:glucose 1-dehydrogenase
VRALVTGAASGIGRAVAVRLARDTVERSSGKASVVLVDLADTALEETAALVRAVGGEAFSIAADLALPEAGQQVTEAVADRLGGKLDVLVSNAGIAQSSPIVGLTLEAYDREFAVNALATWVLVKALHPFLRAARGCVVVTASMSATSPTPGLGAYSPSKAAAAMLVQTMAHELGPDGIRCNSVSPGPIRTPLTLAAYEDPEVERTRIAKIPLRRIGEPEDVAGAVSFLAGPDAAYVTGVDLLVDGGLHTSLMDMVRGAVQL